MVRRSVEYRLSVDRYRTGLTLVELLVAMTVTLIMAFALIQMFQSVGRGVSAGRANLELAGDLRSLSNAMRHELEGITADVRAWREQGSAEGYFEIHDGRLRDAWSATSPQATMYGDIDDIVGYTIRTTGDPFIGRYGGNPITSRVAEVVWWTRWDDWNKDGIPGAGEVTVYHRVLLVRPDLNGSNGYLNNTNTPIGLLQYLQDNDLSVRAHRDNSGNVVGIAANSLADLTRRENRFGHYPINFSTFNFYPLTAGAPPTHAGFPFPISRAQLLAKQTTALAAAQFPGADNQPGIAGVDDDANGTTDDISELGWFGSDDNVPVGPVGDDIALTSVLAFDARVWDPSAELRYNAANTTEILAPGDPGYAGGVNSVPAPQFLPVSHGAFVDLYYGSGIAVTASQFSGAPAAKSRLNLTSGPTYCTWSYDYERDGLDQNASNGADEGTDGFDTDGSNGVDDVGERETSPPYPVPLRGMQIRIRNYDDDTRQARQMTVVTDFIPE